MLETKFLSLMGRYSDDLSYNLKCWSEIETNYTASSRRYHNLDHLKNMLSELEKATQSVINLDALLFSIYYHDIIYKATKSNNEHKSALLFEKRISKTRFAHIDLCKSQIEQTKQHSKSNDSDTNLLLDLDLSILGKDQNDYSEYYKNIRKEYNIYPDFLYYKGRKKVLAHFLEQDKIFKTDCFIDLYEEKARENLHYELKNL